MSIAEGGFSWPLGSKNSASTQEALVKQATDVYNNMKAWRATSCIEDHSLHMHGAVTRFAAGEQQRAEALAALQADREATAIDPKTL